MRIIRNNFTVEKTARFCLNSPSGKIKRLLIVIHGYAQLAYDFIQNFNFLDDENTLIIAPEGLSKFYSRDKPAASWMTKEDRENEIRDYLIYLKKLTIYISEKYDLPDTEKCILGFSQGVHTAVRFFVDSEIHFERLVLCSSDFPKDTDFLKLSGKLNNSKMFYLHGTVDKLFNEQNFLENKKLLETNNIAFKEIIYNGAHIINSEAVISSLE